MSKAKEIVKTTPAFPGLPEKFVFAGRPSTYSKRKTVERMRKYIRKCIDKRQTPFLEEFALSIGVSYDTIRRWSLDDTKPEFAEMYQVLLTVQKVDLKKKSLTGEYVSPIAKLILSAEHNVVERVKQEVTGEDGKPLEIEEKLSPEDRKFYSDQITKIFNKIYSKPDGEQ